MKHLKLSYDKRCQSFSKIGSIPCLHYYLDVDGEPFEESFHLPYLVGVIRGLISGLKPDEYEIDCKIPKGF